MSASHLLTWLLAQDNGGGGGGGPFSQSLLPFVIVVGLLFYFLLIRPERRKQAQHRDLLAGLKKNDRVVTIGGIKGTVVNVVRDADEVTIRVDESSGARLRMQISSVARVERDEPEEKKASEKESS